jgi:hypothetical protein
MVAELVARKNIEEMENPDIVRVKIRTSGCLPNKDGESEACAVFKVMTFGDNTAIENACRISVTREDGKEIQEIDYCEMRRLTIKRNLIEWNLGIPIDRKDGWMTPECYKKVSSVPAPLMEAFLSEYSKHYEVTVDEDTIISKQAAVLFGNNSRGVSNACEAVRTYCALGSFSEKFGVGREELLRMPLRTYTMLKIMVGYENESHRRNMPKPHAGNTRIAGRGGKTRASQGQRIPL